MGNVELGYKVGVNEIDNEGLIQYAMEARKRAYAPYSEFQVGAALLTASGKIYTGCNIENGSYGATNCAERTAFFKAVSEGEGEFRKIAIVGGKAGEKIDFCPPCGICRQVMNEFCDRNSFTIVLTDGKDIHEYSLAELLPFSFSLSE